MDLMMPPLACADYGTRALKYELSESLDQYLLAVFRVENKHSMARVKDIANELGFQKGSVVSALKKLEELGLIVYPPYRPINLTDKGHRLAQYIGWRNGILVRFLTTVLHLAPHEAKELERHIGHALEDKVIDHMRRFMAETYVNLAEPFDVW